MTSIQEWLIAIGFEEYIQRFADNRINMDVLPDLTEEDLGKLEIPLGDGKRIMRAIRSLTMRPEDETEATPPPSSGQPAEPWSAGITEPGQLRQMTVCFVDLVGSTALSEALDLEDYKDLIRSYHLACTRAIGFHDGYVAQYAGDGVMAYFGYPRAQEDDPERAVLAALAIVREVSAIAVSQGGKLTARVGIATGQVLIDGLVYQGVEMIRTAMGGIPNLAARLQTLAEPGAVVVSGQTRRLLGNNFVCEDAGLHQLKGFHDPVQVYRVQEVRTAASRFESRQQGARTPFVNRTEEVTQLQRRWEQACAGKGKVVLLSGEAGIGKSRLAKELADHAAGQGHMRLQFQCSAHHTGSALYPVIAHLEHAARFAPLEPPAEKLGKLSRLLSDSPQDLIDMPVFARLLSLPIDKQEDPLDRLTGRQVREATMNALTARLLRLAEAGPLLMIFEDLHWIDPTSQELLDLLIERIADKRMLLICTFRPEFTPPWTGLPHVTRIDVNRLDRKESATIVANLMGGTGKPQAPVDAIVDKTDGVPLFIEELTKAALESAAGAGRTGARSGGADPLALPSTLKDSLMSRLDRLPLAEKVMPVGAAIGRSFSYRVLAAVTALDDSILLPALSQLVDAELLFQHGEPPDATYTFKHALVQDVAYESVLKSRMRDLHARIAVTIEESFPQVIERRPEIAAHHFSRAALPGRALFYWERAAEKAIARSANSEAVTHIEAALNENQHERDPVARVQNEIRLREMLCVPLEARSWGSEDITVNLNRLHDLVAEHGDAAQLFTVLHGLCGTHMIDGRIERARADALRMMRIAETTGDGAFTVLSRHALGMAAFFLGALDEAIAHFDDAIRARRDVSDAALQKYYVADPEVVGRCMQAWAHVLRDAGGPSRTAAVKVLKRARALVEAAEHDFTRAYGLSILASANQTRGEAKAALELSSRARQLSKRDNFTYWEAWSQIVVGWATAMTGDPERGITLLREGLERYERTGSRQIVAYANALLAEACLKAGRILEGMAAIEEIDEMRESQSVRFYDARIEALRHELQRFAEHGVTT
jgi:class 3 adenylate cyclase/tetratricopeptide (TPR) repeat protein